MAESLQQQVVALRRIAIMDAPADERRRLLQALIEEWRDKPSVSDQ